MPDARKLADATIPQTHAVFAWFWLLVATPFLTETAYEHRSLPSGALDPDRLAVLGDALEDAGCTDAPLLAHPRKPAIHVRGCWAVDAVRGQY